MGIIDQAVLLKSYLTLFWNFQKIGWFWIDSDAEGCGSILIPNCIILITWVWPMVPGFNITLKLFQIRPIIQEVFKLEHLIAGYEAMEKGNLSGKIVVDHTNWIKIISLHYFNVLLFDYCNSLETIEWTLLQIEIETQTTQTLQIRKFK